MNSQLVPFEQLLAAKISATFTNEEAQMYALSFKSFLNHDPDKDMVIDFDLAWSWAGFSRKDNAMRLLRSKFQKDKDYKEVLLRTEGTSNSQSSATKINLTINCFKRFCLKADTKKADTVHDYYIKLEGLFHICHKEYMETQISQLQSQVQQLTISTPTYEEVEKTKTVYVLSTDVPGVYKVGKTKGPLKTRMSQLQTSQVNDIEVILEQKTHDDTILESCCHYVLDKYRSMSNREHFRCKKEYIVQVVTLLAHTLDTLKGTYQTIQSEALIELIVNDIPQSPDNNIESHPAPVNQPTIDVQTDDFYRFLSEKASYQQGATIDLNKVKMAFSSYLNKPIKSLDKGTFFQVNSAFIVSKTNVCKSCLALHKKGCCSNYNRTNRSTRTIVNNLVLAEEFVE